jgi:hypothetical protein
MNSSSNLFNQMKNPSPRNQRRSRFLALLMGLPLLGAFLSVPEANAGTKYWIGAGTWTDPNLWSLTSGGTYDQTWVNADDAVFDVASSTITGAGATTFNSITANQSVTLTAGGTLDPAGSPSIITVADTMSFDFGSQVWGVGQ